MRILDRIYLQKINGNIPALLDNIDEQWPIILHHHYVKEQQKLYIDNIKKKSNVNNYIFITCDFAENYALIDQCEVQSAHWNQQQVTIFTIHIKIGDSHRNLAAISDYDTAFVY